MIKDKRQNFVVNIEYASNLKRRHLVGRLILDQPIKTNSTNKGLLVSLNHMVVFFLTIGSLLRKHNISNFGGIKNGFLSLKKFRNLLFYFP